ncbi:PIN domain-like protein [Choanephora cucurbitarum]|nr:PIN domain-like protein [Choanephora cucurbitarum]
MGVHGLTGILSRYAPKSVQNVSCAAFAAQTIAIDASCHLNKFIYGDEPHAHRHIYGFYQLTRFCDMNNIKPIFVFDGLRRLEAKKLEHAKRERSRRKVKHSLLFEREQSLRLDNWAEVSDMYDQTDISKESMHAILGELSDTIDEIEKVEEEQEAPPLTDQKAISDEKQFEIESKLTQIAQELRVAVAIAEDSEKYTRTVRDLARRERELVSDIIVHRSDGLRPALDQLRRDNQTMLQSLGILFMPDPQYSSFFKLIFLSLYKKNDRFE